MLFIVRYLSSLLEFQFLDMKTIKNSVKLWQNKKGRIFVCHARQNDVFFTAEIYWNKIDADYFNTQTAPIDSNCSIEDVLRTNQKTDDHEMHEITHNRAKLLRSRIYNFHFSTISRDIFMKFGPKIL